MIDVDKNVACPVAMETLRDETLAEITALRQVKYLNNVVEQDHRIKRITRPMMESKSFDSTRSTLSGIETRKDK